MESASAEGDGEGLFLFMHLFREGACCFFGEGKVFVGWAVYVYDEGVCYDFLVVVVYPCVVVSLGEVHGLVGYALLVGGYAFVVVVGVSFFCYAESFMECLPVLGVVASPGAGVDALLVCVFWGEEAEFFVFELFDDFVLGCEVVVPCVF